MKRIRQALIVIITIILIAQTIYAQTSGSGPGKVNKYGIFEYTLPPDWVLNKEHTNNEFLTFSHIVIGELRYHVRIKLKTTPVKNHKEL